MFVIFEYFTVSNIIYLFHVVAYTGLISESRKRRIQQGLSGNQMFEDVGDEIVAKPRLNETDSNNPWGVLALSWSNYDRNRPKPGN